MNIIHKFQVSRHASLVASHGQPDEQRHSRKNIMVPEVRRDPEKPVSRLFGGFVNNPVLENYSLHYAPSGFRKWSEYGIAMAAMGSYCLYGRSCH